MKKHVVQTEALEIVDEQGHVRLRLGISHDQQPFISMLDLSGVVRARFGVEPEVCADGEGPRLQAGTIIPWRGGEP